MVALSKPIGVEEFMSLPDDGNRHELVRGEVRVMPPPKGKHGFIEAAISAAMDRYLDSRAQALDWTPEQGPDSRARLVGFVAVGEFGMQFSLPDDPVQIRGADGAYVAPEQYARVAASWTDETYFPEVPHLVVEVISPSETAADVEEKVQDYLDGGARRVWCIYPKRRRVHVHADDGLTRVVRWDEDLTDDALLPGFSLPLRHIFLAPPQDIDGET